MSQFVNITLFDNDAHFSNQLSFHEAKTLVANSIAEGSAVVNRKTGMIIDELTPNIDDVYVIRMKIF